MRSTRNGVGGIFHPTQDYKGSIILTPLDITATPTVNITMLGVFPLGIPEYHFDSAAAERMNPEIMFSCDNVVISGATGGSSSGSLTNLPSSVTTGLNNVSNVVSNINNTIGNISSNLAGISL